jgi:hypothetical protein
MIKILQGYYGIQAENNDYFLLAFLNYNIFYSNNHHCLLPVDGF